MLLSCRNLTEMLTNEREGKLSSWQRFKVRLHLKICGPCKRYTAQMDATVAALKTLREEPPDDVHESLVESFRKHTRGG